MLLVEAVTGNGLDQGSALEGGDRAVCELACLQASSASNRRSLPFNADAGLEKPGAKRFLESGWSAISGERFPIRPLSMLTHFPACNEFRQQLG
jgi:hypothetical protein